MVHTCSQKQSQQLRHTLLQADPPDLLSPFMGSIVARFVALALSYSNEGMKISWQKLLK